MVVQKDVFWKAAIITVTVFLLGVLLGYILESARLSEIEKEYQNVEIEWADAKLQTTYYSNLDIEACDAAINENLKFADKVYQQGLTLERYENANKIRDKAEYEKQKYALLKVEFWLNSMTLRGKCNANYTNLVYFYLDNPSITQKPLQDTQSVILTELKEKFGSKIMLIPLPSDKDIAIINIMKSTYNITQYPALLINEKVKLEGLHSISEIEPLI